MPDKKDKWWTLSDEASYASVESEVRKAVSDLAIPLIKPHLTEQGLLELWASNTPGPFEYPNLKCKSILLALQRKFEELPDIFQRSPGKDFEFDRDFATVIVAVTGKFALVETIK